MARKATNTSPLSSKTSAASNRKRTLDTTTTTGKTTVAIASSSSSSSINHGGEKSSKMSKKTMLPHTIMDHDADEIMKVNEQNDQNVQSKIMDLQRLLHSMEKYNVTTTLTTTKNVASMTISYQDVLMRADLVESMWNDIENRTNSFMKNEEELKHAKELHHRVVVAVQQSRLIANSIRLQEQEKTTTSTEMTTAALVDRLFSTQQVPIIDHMVVAPPPPHLASILLNKRQPTIEISSSSREHGEDEKKSSKPIAGTAAAAAVASSTTTRNNTTIPLPSKSIATIQSEQQEQMEEAIQQMAKQMKHKMENLHETIKQQNTNVLNDMETIVEDNVVAVTDLSKATTEQLSKSWSSTVRTYVTIITVVGMFVFTLVTIMMVPKQQLQQYNNRLPGSSSCLFFCDSSTKQQTTTAVVDTPSPVLVPDSENDWPSAYHVYLKDDPQFEKAIEEHVDDSNNKPQLSNDYENNDNDNHHTDIHEKKEEDNDMFMNAEVETENENDSDNEEEEEEEEEDEAESDDEDEEEEGSEDDEVGGEQEEEQQEENEMEQDYNEVADPEMDDATNYEENQYTDEHVDNMQENDESPLTSHEVEVEEQEEMVHMGEQIQDQTNMNNDDMDDYGELPDVEPGSFQPVDISYAATTGQYSLLRAYLLQKKGWLNIQDPNGWAPIHEATAMGITKSVQILIEEGCSLTLETTFYQNALDIALERHSTDHPVIHLLMNAMGVQDLVQYLHERMAQQQERLDQKQFEQQYQQQQEEEQNEEYVGGSGSQDGECEVGPDGQCLNHENDDSIYNENVQNDDVVFVLHGEPFTTNDLRLASMVHENTELLQGYLDVVRDNTVFINEADENGWTALHLAVNAGIYENVQLLLQYGSDRNSLTRYTNNTPLDIAYHKFGGSHPITQLLDE